MTRKSLNTEFGLVAGVAILSAFLTEVFHEPLTIPYFGYVMESGLTWTMPLALALTRFFIVKHTSRLKDLYPLETNTFDAWAWGTTSLIALFIYYLWDKEENPITADVHWALQAGNIILVGAEFYYGRLILKTDDVKREIDFDKQSELHREDIETASNRIETLSTRNRNLSRIARGFRKQIEIASRTIDAQSDEMESLSKAIEDSKTVIENQSKMIEEGKKAIEKIAELRKGKRHKNGTVVLHGCGEITYYGIKAKEPKCLGCGKPVLI